MAAEVVESSISEAERMLAQGRKVPVKGGGEVTVRYDMLGLYRLERMYGSLLQVSEQLQNRIADSKLVEPVARMLLAGVEQWGDEVDDWSSEHEIELGIFSVLKQLVPEHFGRYWLVVSEAMAESFPNLAAPESTTKTGGNRSERRSPSRGASGTTPARSRSAVRKKPSGA